jgi:hypothetical protein
MATEEVPDAILNIKEKEEKEPITSNLMVASSERSKKNKINAKKEVTKESVSVLEKTEQKNKQRTSKTLRKTTEAAPLPLMLNSATSLHPSNSIPSIKTRRTPAYSNLSISTKTSSLLPPVAPSAAVTGKQGGVPGGWQSHRAFNMKFPPPKLHIDTNVTNRPQISPLQSLTPKAIGEISSKKLTSLYATNPSISRGVSSAGDLSQYEPPRQVAHQQGKYAYTTTNNTGVWMYDSPRNAYSLSPHPIQYQQQHQTSRPPMSMVGRKSSFHVNDAPVGFQRSPSPRMFQQQQQQHFHQNHQLTYPHHTPRMVHCVRPTNGQFLPPLVATRSTASYLDTRSSVAHDAHHSEPLMKSLQTAGRSAIFAHSDSSVRSPTSSILENFLPTPPPRGPSVNVKDLTLNELRPHFNKPMAAVAKELGVCITLMKKICRRNGLIRWPHRRIRSLVNRITSLQVIAGNSTGTERKRFQTQIAALREELSLVIQNPNEKSRKAQADAKARSPTSVSPWGLKMTTPKGKRSKDENEDEAGDDDLDDDDEEVEEEEEEEEELENDGMTRTSVEVKSSHTKVSPLCGAMKQQQNHIIVANNSTETTEIISCSTTTMNNSTQVQATKKRKNVFDEPVKKKKERKQLTVKSSSSITSLPAPPNKISGLEEEEEAKLENGEEILSNTGGGNQKRGSISSILC